MEQLANVPQSNKPVTPTTQDVSLTQVGQQLQYPLDYVTQEIIKQFLNSAYPVGSIYISVVSTNPSTLLGVGAWTAFGAGRTLVGIDSGQTEFDTVEETGGAKTHTLSVSEIPSHTHTANRTGGSGEGTLSWALAGGDSNAYTSGATGGDGAHNNLQPYIVTYMWKRTS